MVGENITLRGTVKNDCIRMFLLVLVIWSLPLMGGVWGAEQFPTRSITIINPYPPGAATDLTARILAPKLSDLLGQSVVVVNKTGGGGAIGMKFVAQSKPDGYTLLVSPSGWVCIPLITPDIGFKTKDLAPVSLATSVVYVIAVNSSSPWKSLKDLIDYAKKNPGKLKYSSSGPGGTSHLAGELVKIVTGIDITHVPMNGTGPAVVGLLGGHVDLTFASTSTLRKHIEAGTLRGLAMMDVKRNRYLPQIPSAKEEGYPGIQVISWYGFGVPQKTPIAIVDKLSNAFHQALMDKEVIASLEKADLMIDNMGPKDFEKFLDEETQRWSEVIRKGKITSEN
jgi:tripartite-type tricarboxylate transporter receptor subunit TctC